MMRLCITICLLLAAGLSQAEVRVVERSGGLALEVQATARGVWTVSRAGGRGASLNTEGDVYGDGYPSHSQSERGLIVAWARPSGVVHVALADSSGELWRRAIDAPGVVGVPVVVDLGTSDLIAWSSNHDGGTVYVAFHLGDGQFSEALLVDQGELVGLVKQGSSGLLIVRDTLDNELRLWTVLLPEPVPIPIKRLIGIEVLRDLSRSSSLSQGAPVPCIASTPDRACVAWRVGPGAVQVITIQDGHVLSAGVTRGGNACQAADANLR